MYQYLIFDMDDTLSNDYENRKHAFKKVLEYMDEDITEDRIQEMINYDIKYWNDRANGKIKDPANLKTIEEINTFARSKRFIDLFGNINLEKAIKINDIFVEALKENIVPIENAKEIIKYLYEKKYNIIIATNGPTSALLAKITGIGINKYLENTFAADEIGYMKPKKEFVEGLLNKIKFYDKSKILIIGDDNYKDVKCGIDNGIDTCWFDWKNEKEIYKSTYKISKLSELKKIL